MIIMNFTKYQTTFKFKLSLISLIKYRNYKISLVRFQKILRLKMK